ncbi:MAG: hypothetical protein ABW007_12075 [Chitinophagaceae bacterium]
MRWIKWVGLIAGLLLIASCFMLWASLPARNITISGVNAEGTSFGKPGYFHLLLASVFLVLHFIPRIWAKRTNLVVAALNIAWAVRNYFIITVCRQGECPEKHTGIYLVLIASVFVLIAVLFPDMKLPQQPANGASQQNKGATP